MSDLNTILTQRDEVLARIRGIEETCEGIDNENNAKKVSQLNMRQAELSAEKTTLIGKLSSLEHELNKISEEIRSLSGTGIERILKAIKTQRWFYFKNKPRVIMDRDTGFLWPNLDYFNTKKNENTFYTLVEAKKSASELQIDGFNDWKIPSKNQIIKMINDKKFPFQKGNNHQINDYYYWFCFDDSNNVRIDLDNYSMSNSGDSAALLPCYTNFVYNSYEKDVSVDNKIYKETERLQFTLNLFINNGLQPIFNDDEITQLYKKIYFEKPALIQKLNELQEQVQSLQKLVLLSSDFDYNSLLLKYDIKSIDSSIIKYHEAVVSVIDELMDKLHYYEEVKSEIIRDFNVIGLKLSKKYEDNPNLTDAENRILKNRQAFFKRHFELGMNSMNSKLLAIKKQAEDIEDRIENINSGENSIKELSILEKEERASFKFIVENAATIIKNALLKIEFFESNKKFATNVVKLWDNWSEEYKIFKTTLKDNLNNACEDDSIESEIYSAWYDEWQKKRLVVEERFLPLIERGLKGRLIDVADNESTVIEKVLALLQEYKDGIDKFYLEERKNIYQKFAFQAGGDLQEKFEAESELYKLVLKLQRELQDIIFSLEKSEDRLFLLKWAEILLDLQIDEVLDFVKYKELSKISLDVLTEFADLKRKNFEVYISDSKAYSEELQRREKEYNSLIFKMRKDLMKQ
jgi:hypothetical protein